MRFWAYMRKHLLRIVSDLEIYGGSNPAWWWGEAYRMQSLRRTVFAPIPLNLLIGWGRRLIWHLSTGKLTKLERAEDRGWREGFAEGRDVSEAHVERMIAITLEGMNARPN